MPGAPIPNAECSSAQCCDLAFDGTPVTAANPLPVDATLIVGDIEIGAVEIKNDVTDDRAKVIVGTTAVPGDFALVVVDAVATTLATNGVAGTATNVVDAVVGAASGIILAAAATRKGAVIQNVGTANIRVTVDGVDATATLGQQLVPGASMTLTMPFCPTAAIKAIREGASSSSVSVTSIV